MKKIISFSYFLLIIVIIQCKKDQPDLSADCTDITPTYTNDIAPIINTSCAISKCHNATSKADGKDYSTYNLTKAGAANNSFLGSIQHLSGYKAMPENANKLDDSKIKLIVCWIKNGFPQ